LLSSPSNGNEGRYRDGDEEDDGDITIKSR
jgi:hypothetical protein